MANDNQLRALCNGIEVRGPATFTFTSLKGAVWRAVKSFFLALIGGILVIPIPLVHIFGLVLIVISPFGAILVFFKSRGSFKGMSGSFECPVCHAPNIMDYQEGKAPYYGSCRGCHNPYQVFPILRSTPEGA